MLCSFGISTEASAPAVLSFIHYLCEEIKRLTIHTVETGLLAHALLGSIAELYTLIFENAPIMQSF